MAGVMRRTNYKLLSGDPASASAENIKGSAYASHVGTPDTAGRYLIHIRGGRSGEATLMADVSEYESGGIARSIPVEAGGSYTSLIPGMTITLGGTVNAQDSFRIRFSRLVPEAA